MREKVFDLTNNFDPGGKMTQGSVFNVTYWTLDQFSTLKIETLGCEIYTRLILHYIFYLSTCDLNKLKIDLVEYWPLGIEVWTTVHVPFILRATFSSNSWLNVYVKLVPLQSPRLTKFCPKFFCVWKYYLCWHILATLCRPFFFWHLCP